MIPEKAPGSHWAECAEILCQSSQITQLYLQAGSLRQSLTVYSAHIQLIQSKTPFNCEQQSIALSFHWGGLIRVWSKIIIAAVSNSAVPDRIQASAQP